VASDVRAHRVISDKDSVGLAPTTFVQNGDIVSGDILSVDTLQLLWRITIHTPTVLAWRSVSVVLEKGLSLLLHPLI
jgi:hypothetical protein